MLLTRWLNNPHPMRTHFERWLSAFASSQRLVRQDFVQIGQGHQVDAVLQTTGFRAGIDHQRAVQLQVFQRLQRVLQPSRAALRGFCKSKDSAFLACTTVRASVVLPHYRGPMSATIGFRRSPSDTRCRNTGRLSSFFTPCKLSDRHSIFQVRRPLTFGSAVARHSFGTLGAALWNPRHAARSRIPKKVAPRQFQSSVKPEHSQI